MADFNVQEFQTKVFVDGLAEPSKFEMMISPPRVLAREINLTKTVSLLTEISNFPPLNIMVRTMNLYGPQHQRPVSMDFGGDGLAASFYLDRQMQVKRFFDTWMASIVNAGTHNVAYQSDYITEMTIRQLSDGGNQDPRGSTERPTYAVTLQEAFPRSMNLVDLNTGAQNQTSRLTVVFAFRKWTYESTFTGPTAPGQSTLNNLEAQRSNNVFYYN